MSTIKTETLSTPSNATVPVDTVVNGTAKAWVNFNGTSTVAIRRAFNVSSITDNGTADYTVNFTTAMVDADYSVIGLSGNNTTSLACVCQPRNLSAPTTSAVRLQAVRADGVKDVDPPVVCVSIFS